VDAGDHLLFLGTVPLPLFTPQFKTYAAKSEDVNQGGVWLRGHDDLLHRAILKLSARETGETVYRERRSYRRQLRKGLQQTGTRPYRNY